MTDYSKVSLTLKRGIVSSDFNTSEELLSNDVHDSEEYKKNPILGTFLNI